MAHVGPIEEYLGGPGGPGRVWGLLASVVSGFGGLPG